jgi:hypothetical protein
MQTIPIDDSWFEGAVSVAEVDGGLLPCRLPWAERKLWHPAIADGAALMASGVRLRFATEAAALELAFAPLPPHWTGLGHHFDLTVDGELIASCHTPVGSTRARFDLPKGERTVEIWFPQGSPVTLLALRADGPCRLVPDPRPKWTTYGSSLTHCVRAHSPARTWPAIVARRRGLNLTCLGYGGQCHLEALAGLMIRDLPADLITLKLGINTVGGSMAQRVFYPAVTGLVRVIREKHRFTPLALISPIAYQPHEQQPNVVGVTMEGMRRDIEEAYRQLTALGDDNLIYVNGLEIFDEPLLAQYSVDQCHPGADGIEVMAERFDRAVMERLPQPVPI